MEKDRDETLVRFSASRKGNKITVTEHPVNGGKVFFRGIARRGKETAFLDSDGRVLRIHQGAKKPR